MFGCDLQFQNSLLYHLLFSSGFVLTYCKFGNDNNNNKNTYNNKNDSIIEKSKKKR